MATKAKAAKREAGKVSASKSTDKVVIVKPSDIWRGTLPKRGEGYMRDKAAMTAIAYPLIDMANLRVENDCVVVSFPKEIVLPKTFTQDEIRNAINCLATF
jgi:hypothetical protein